jgi:hypothetical protein
LKVPLREGGILRSILCAPRVPSDIAEAAKRFSATEVFGVQVVDLELRPLVAGKTPQGWDSVTYGFFYPGTNDVEAVLSFYRHPTSGLNWEISRVASYKQTFFKDGAEIISSEAESHVGYWWGLV